MESSRWTAGLLLILTFALGLSLGFIVHSQLFTGGGPRGPGGLGGPGGPRGPGGPSFGDGGLIPPALRDRVTEELGLTQEQSEVFEQILENHRTQVIALRRDIMQPQQRAISDSTRARFERLLTPDQMRRFGAFRQSFRRGQFRGPPRGRPGGPPGRYND